MFYPTIHTTIFSYVEPDRDDGALDYTVMRIDFYNVSAGFLVEVQCPLELGSSRRLTKTVYQARKSDSELFGGVASQAAVVYHRQERL